MVKVNTSTLGGYTSKAEGEGPTNVKMFSFLSSLPKSRVLPTRKKVSLKQPDRDSGDVAAWIGRAVVPQTSQPRSITTDIQMSDCKSATDA